MCAALILAVVLTPVVLPFIAPTTETELNRPAPAGTEAIALDVVTGPTSGAGKPH